MTSRESKLLLILIAAGALYLFSRSEKGQVFTAKITDNLMSNARGIRNNNPGNIRHNPANKWLGTAPTQTDSSFVQFVSPEYGIRALAVILRNYRARGIGSVRQIISTWAPPSENDTESYIRQVSKAVNAPDSAQVTDAMLPSLVAAIIKHENGTQPYSPEIIAKGLSLA